MGNMGRNTQQWNPDFDYKTILFNIILLKCHLMFIVGLSLIIKKLYIHSHDLTIIIL